MQFLKSLLLIFTVALAVAFAFNNPENVSVRLWGDLLLDINLPLLLLAAFLLGLLPTWIWQRAVRWRLQHRLSVTERTVAELRAAASMAPVVQAPPARVGDAA